ncbi:hypothetical protein QIA41_05840 (plasmid) [Borreliella sinica]|uniref:hypothetical protein n=1 Tax=Borreliella sinica TaxID=87162 RepID=UPI003AEF8A88
MNKKMLIICAVFALIISCKNYASGENLKQNLKGQVNGFKEGVEKKVKQGIKQAEQKVKGFLAKEEKIISDEIAEKLKEKKENKQEEKKEQAKEGEKQEKQEELIQGDDPNNINQAQILQANSQDSAPELETVQQSESGGQQKDKEERQEKERQEKERQEKERQEKERQEKERQERERQEKERQEKERQEKERQERERQEKERQEKERQEREQTNIKIKKLTNKIDKINKDIDSIKHQSWFVEGVERVIVGAQEVIDKVTGPIYDYFTDKSDTAIYYTWGLADEEDSELGKVLKKLSETRSNLRTKLNVGNKKPIVLSRTEPKLKENVKVSEIESDLDSLKSELEEVKNYLEDESNFEKIEEYINEDED